MPPLRKSSEGVAHLKALVWFYSQVTPSQSLPATAQRDLCTPHIYPLPVGCSRHFLSAKKMEINSFLPLSCWSVSLQGQKRTELAQERKREHSPEREETWEQHCPSSKYTSVSKAWLVPWTPMGSSTKISQRTRNDVLSNASHTRNNTDTNCIKYIYIYNSLVFSNQLDTRAEKLPIPLTE